MGEPFEVTLPPGECLDRIGRFIAVDAEARGEFADREGGWRVDVVKRWESGMELHQGGGAGSFTVEVIPTAYGTSITVRRSRLRELLGGEDGTESIESLVRRALADPAPDRIAPDDPRYRAVVDKRFNKRFAG